MCRLSRNLGATSSWNPQSLPRPVQGLLTAIRKHNRMPHTKTTIGVCITVSIFKFLTKTSNALKFEHDIQTPIRFGTSWVPSSGSPYISEGCALRIGPRLSIFSTFQCIRVWCYKMYFTLRTVRTILKKSSFSFKIFPPDSSVAHYIQY
jgi:hypothetical protein